jgi:hypothetical protein
MRLRGGQNTTNLLAKLAMVLTKQHVSAYLEVIIRFTNVGYRRLVYIAESYALMLRSHHLRFIKTYLKTVVCSGVLQEIGYEGVEWIYLAYDMNRLWAPVKTVINLRVT